MNRRPRKLFKYRALDAEGRTERIIRANELYFSAPSEFNDPFEFRFALSMEGTFEERLDKFRKAVPVQRPNLTPYQCEQVAQQLAQTLSLDPVSTARGLSDMFSAKNGILSLSARNDDILMWSHYADNHKGLCLEFDMTLEEPFLAARVLPVDYSATYPVVEYFRDLEFTMVKKIALTKASHWSYEEEWRILDPFNGRSTQRFPQQLLTGVILGARVSDEVRSRVSTWIAEHGTPITLYQADVRPDAYALKIVPQE
jgi:hypothetical protein